MTYHIAVTFESENQGGPQTVRTVVEAASVGTALRRAYQQARKALPKRRWESLVVLVQRGEEA
jgi:hypothetical protein